MNSTPAASDSIQIYYVVGSLSIGFALIAIFISCVIFTLVWRTKPRLHTLKHLLICNTCLASIVYCIVQSNNYIFIIFLPWETSDWSCRWRGYFSYMTISAVIYSYLVQAISRFFFSVLSTKYRILTTFKAHITLTLAHWFIVLLLPLPSIVTKDIVFVPFALCWVTMEHTTHIVYTAFVYYLLPIICIIIIYTHIYYRVKRTKKSGNTAASSQNAQKRNLEVLRNILLLLGIYILGAIPTLLFMLTSIRLLYYVGIVSVSLTVAVEKVCTIVLDRDIRQIVWTLISRMKPIVPFGPAATLGRTQQKFDHYSMKSSAIALT